MIEQHPKEEILSIIKEIEANPTASQRNLSQKLGISLGKTNYLLNELIKKGIIRIKHFSLHDGKLSKISYFLTKKGLVRKLDMLEHFLRKKKAEYDLLKQEWNKLRSN